MTTRNQVGGWFDQGLSLGATHMLVVVDKFDYEDYPIFVQVDPDFPEDKELSRTERVIVTNDTRRAVALFDGPNMQGVMECYDLRMGKVEQLGEYRAFHY